MMGKFNKNESGFGAVEVIIILVVIVIIGAVGWYVWHRNNTTISNSTATSTTSDTRASQNSQQSDVQTIPPQQGIRGTTWTTITKQKILLSDWKVTLTLPTSLLGKAIVSPDGGNTAYSFWIKAAKDNTKCTGFFSSVSEGYDGLMVSQYSPSTKVEGQLDFNFVIKDEQSLTLDQYYLKHKATDGNYFQNPGTDIVSQSRKYWKVGNNFYIAFTVPTIFSGSNKAAFTNACPNVPADYETTFSTALSTMQM